MKLSRRSLLAAIAAAVFAPKMLLTSEPEPYRFELTGPLKYGTSTVTIADPFMQPLSGAHAWAIFNDATMRYDLFYRQPDGTFKGKP